MTVRLLFDTDYTADSVWDEDGMMVDLDWLPVSEGTRRAIRAWARRWDQLAMQRMHADDVNAGMVDGPDAPVPPAVWEQHERDGRQLWLELRQQLGSHYQVGWVSYCGDSKLVEWEPGGPTQTCPAPGCGP